MLASRLLIVSSTACSEGGLAVAGAAATAKLQRTSKDAMITAVAGKGGAEENGVRKECVKRGESH